MVRSPRARCPLDACGARRERRPRRSPHVAIPEDLVDQNRKPGAPPAKDISDLKARLGLKRPEAAPAPAPGGPGMARPTGVLPTGFPQAPGRAMPGAPAAAPAAPPAALDPYAGMKPQQGVFDLRTIDDGAPVENVRSGRG